MLTKLEPEKEEQGEDKEDKEEEEEEEEENVETSTTLTTPLVTPITEHLEDKETQEEFGKPSKIAIMVNKLASNCAEDPAALEQLERQIDSCQDILVNSCKEFEVILQCLTDVKESACHLFDMASFEYDLNAFLIERYNIAPFASDCLPYKKLQGHIFQTSTKLCSQNYITEQKVKKEECSIVEEHNLILQVKFKSR